MNFSSNDMKMNDFVNPELIVNECKLFYKVILKSLLAIQRNYVNNLKQ